MHVGVVLLCVGSQRQGDSGAAAHRRQRQHAVQHQPQQAGEQEAHGPSQPHASKPGESTMTSPSQHPQQQQQQQQRKRHAPGQQDSAAAAAKKRARSSLTNGYHPPSAAAAAAAAGAGSSWQQQHWQQMSGLLEGAGQVGGRANSLRFSCGGGGGGPDMSAQQGISSKVYGSMDAGFASGSKAEGSLSYGGLDGCCSIGNAMASVANGTGVYRRNEEQEHSQEVQHDGDTAGADSGGSRPRMPTQEQGQQVAQSGSTGKPARDSSGRPPSAGGAAAAAAAAGGSLQEGEGSHGSRSQDGARYKRRRRTSCEVASVQHRMASSMQTTEA